MSQTVRLSNRTKAWEEHLYRNPYRDPRTPRQPAPQRPVPQGAPDMVTLLTDLAEGHEALMRFLEQLSEQLEALEARVDELVHAE